MSDNWLRYVPTDPEYQPTRHQAEKAKALLSELLPRAEAISSKFSDSPIFVDPGANFSGVLCPVCNAVADDWWGEAMSAAAETNFTSLAVQAPCCGSSTSLNEMHYLWPAAFGRYVLEAVNPNENGLARDQLAQLESMLGHSLREIRVHI